MIIWLTGRSGAGKTRLAKELMEIPFQRRPWFLVEGERMRQAFSPTAYTAEGRERNVARCYSTAAFLEAEGYNVIVAAVSPNRQQRESFKTRRRPLVCEVYLPGLPEYLRPDYVDLNYQEPILDHFTAGDTSDLETVCAQIASWAAAKEKERDL